MSITHLSQVGGLPDKTKCDVACRLMDLEMKTSKEKGTTYFKGKVCGVGDPNTHMWVTFFGNSPHAWANRDCVLKGAEKGSYNGNPQLMLGKFGKIEEYVQEFEAAPPPSSPRPAPQTPPNAARTPATGIPAGGATMVHGAIVGGALARAVEIWLQTDCKQGGQVWNEDAPRQIEKITRDLVEIQQRIERGEPAQETPPF